MRSDYYTSANKDDVRAAGANVDVAIAKNPAQTAAVRYGVQWPRMMALRLSTLPKDGMDIPLTTESGTPNRRVEIARKNSSLW